MNPIIARFRSRRGLSILGISAALIGFAGCGPSDPTAIPAVKAGGTVTYQGKPVATGSIQFSPEVGRAASGSIKDGKFTLSTYVDNDGAVPGKHRVAVIATEDVKTKDYDVAVKYLVPQKYASPETSGTDVEIPPGGKTDIVIDLK